jgi:hypothetical protein
VDKYLVIVYGDTVMNAVIEAAGLVGTEGSECSGGLQLPISGPLEIKAMVPVYRVLGKKAVWCISCQDFPVK